MTKEYWRCRYCGQLFSDEEVLDYMERKGFLSKMDITGYQCPNGCKKPFNQPPYESPTL